MNNKYLYEITKLIEQTNPKLAIRHKLAFKNVFGAVGGYVDNRIFISCGKFGVALKLPKGHIKKKYAVLPKRILENEHQLRKLVDESIKYAFSL